MPAITQCVGNMSDVRSYIDLRQCGRNVRLLELVVRVSTLVTVHAYICLTIIARYETTQRHQHISWRGGHGACSQTVRHAPRDSHSYVKPRCQCEQHRRVNKHSVHISLMTCKGIVATTTTAAQQWNPFSRQLAIVIRKFGSARCPPNGASKVKSQTRGVNVFMHSKLNSEEYPSSHGRGTWIYEV